MSGQRAPVRSRGLSEPPASRAYGCFAGEPVPPPPTPGPLLPMPPESIANVLFMSSGGEIDRHETEIVILRVAHLRRCQRVLLTALDELVRDKDIQDETWSALRSEYSIPQLVELCLLVGHYEMLATTITALRIPRDFATER